MAAPADRFGFFRSMNLVIVLMIVGAMATLILPTALDTRSLKFQETAESVSRATNSRFGKTYEIERVETSGSGEYTEMTISLIEAEAKTRIATYSTCGHYRDEGMQILFFEPHDFHCRFFSSRWNDLFSPRTSRVEFSETGATASFLPTEPQ